MNQSKIRKVGDGLGANNSSWTFKVKLQNHLMIILQNQFRFVKKAKIGNSN